MPLQNWNKRRLNPGQQIGWFTVIGYVRKGTKGHSYARTKVRVQCKCGNRETIPQFYLTRPQPKFSCGCHRKTIKTIYPQERTIYHMMHVRCEDPTHVGYKYYGGRGIKVCERWSGAEGFKNFLEDIGPRPSPKHSIDRVDVDGNYEPIHPVTKERQVRWATGIQQAANKRKKPPYVPPE